MGGWELELECEVEVFPSKLGSYVTQGEARNISQLCIQFIIALDTDFGSKLLVQLVQLVVNSGIGIQSETAH